MNLNKVMIGGRIGKIDIRPTNAGTEVANFSVAVNKRVTRKGVKEEVTTWFNCVAFGKLANICAQYLTKGSGVFVEGEIQTRDYIDKAGVKKTVFEVLANEVSFLDRTQSGTPHTLTTSEVDSDYLPF